MKVSVVIVLAATSTYAQLSRIQSVLNSVQGAIDSLDSAVKEFNGDIVAVNSKGDALVSAITAGKTNLDASTDLALTDALGLPGPVQALTRQAQTLADDFRAKRSDIEKAGACNTVRSKLGDINTSSQALVNSVTSKVPQNAQSIAQQLAGSLIRVLNQAQDDFSVINCQNSGGSGGSKSGDSSQTATATTPALSTPALPIPALTTQALTTPAPTTAVPTGGSENSTATAGPIPSLQMPPP